MSFIDDREIIEGYEEYERHTQELGEQEPPLDELAETAMLSEEDFDDLIK